MCYIFHATLYNEIEAFVTLVLDSFGGGDGAGLVPGSALQTWRLPILSSPAIQCEGLRIGSSLGPTVLAITHRQPSGARAS